MAFAPSTTERRTTISCSGSRSGARLWSTSPRCSTTGARRPRAPRWTRRPSPTPRLSGERAVAAHLERTGHGGSVLPTDHPGFYHVELTPDPGVCQHRHPDPWAPAARSAVNDRVLVVEAVRSIVAHQYRTEFEIVVVHDRDADRGYLDDLARIAGPRLRVVEFDPPFNFSAKVNLGAERAQGDVLVFLNDDIEVMTPRWLDQLVALAQRDEVGAVGAKLLFDDDRIQHVGHLYAGGKADHIAFKRPDGPGPFAANILDREVSGVTAACMVQRRDVWRQLGGFDETLPNNFNDVDYCMRIRARGLDIVQANSVVLRHHESQTRRAKVAAWEAERIQGRWADQLSGEDPYTRESARSRNPLAGRPLREWWRISKDVVIEEGPSTFAAKANRRLRGSAQ